MKLLSVIFYFLFIDMVVYAIFLFQPGDVYVLQKQDD